MIDTHPNYSSSGELVGFTVQVTKEHIESFRKCISKGCNTWDTAPADIKSLHDTIIHGYCLQDYKQLEESNAMSETNSLISVVGKS